MNTSPFNTDTSRLALPALRPASLHIHRARLQRQSPHFVHNHGRNSNIQIFNSFLFYSEWSDFVQLGGFLLCWSSHAWFLIQRLWVTASSSDSFNILIVSEDKISTCICYNSGFRHRIILDLRDYSAVNLAGKLWDRRPENRHPANLCSNVSF